MLKFRACFCTAEANGWRKKETRKPPPNSLLGTPERVPSQGFPNLPKAGEVEESRRKENDPARRKDTPYCTWFRFQPLPTKGRREKQPSLGSLEQRDVTPTATLQRNVSLAAGTLNHLRELDQAWVLPLVAYSWHSTAQDNGRNQCHSVRSTI